MGGFRDRGWRQVGLGLCKVGGVGSRSNSTPWILCSAVRTISNTMEPALAQKNSNTRPTCSKELRPLIGPDLDYRHEP